MKYYIFFPPNIHIIGGGQLYVLGKAKWLEKQGWKVFMFFVGDPYGECEIKELERYVSGCGFAELNKISYKCPAKLREQALQKMVDILRIDETVENQIVIESTICIWASWAELLAERIHGRHFFMSIEESYRVHYPPYESWYEDNLDFFYFKYKRNELISSPVTLQNLFQGYPGTEQYMLKVPKDVHLVQEQDPIQDVENPLVEKIERSDLNICYIGRTDKSYVKAVFQGVREFVLNHPDKQIQFVIVGNFISPNMVAWSNDLFRGIKNLRIAATQSLVPIPRNLFKKLDVVIAGAQTAVFSAYEGIPVIAAIVDSDKTAGCLYYDMDDAWFGQGAKHISYVEALDNVLIKEKYKNKKPHLPKRYPAEWHYEKSFEIQMTQATQPLEYFTEKFSKDSTRDWFAQFPYHLVAKGARIVIYGAGEIARDYIRQISDETYCKLVGIVADDHEHFDRSVMPPEKLTELKYDGIVIAKKCTQQELDAITKKIFQITGKNNFAYRFRDVIVQ